MKILILLVITSTVFAQSKIVITGKDLKVLQFPIPNFTLVSGTPKVFTSTDIQVQAGSTGSLSLDDSSKVVLFLANNPGLTLNYTVTSTATVMTVAANSYVDQSGVVLEGNAVAATDKNDWIRYAINVSSKTKVSINYALGDTQSAVVDFRTGSITGTIIASATLPVTGSWTTFVQSADFVLTPQVGDIYVTFSRGRITGNSNLMSFRFK